MSLSSLVWNLGHGGLVEIQLGDGSMGRFAAGPAPSTTAIAPSTTGLAPSTSELAAGCGGRPQTVTLCGATWMYLAWRGGRGRGFLPKRALWVTARDGYSFVGVVPDDGNHELRAARLQDGCDVFTGAPYLGVVRSVPARLLCLFCDRWGNAIFSDGFEIPSVFERTAWQRDAATSLDGVSVTPGFWRMRDERPDTLARLSREMTDSMVSRAVEHPYGWKTNYLSGVTITLVLVALYFLISTGYMGVGAVWGRVLTFATVGILCLVGICRLLITAGTLDREGQLGRAHASMSAEELERLGDASLRRRRRTHLPTLLAVAAFLGALWWAGDLVSPTVTYVGTYEGPDYAELMHERSTDNWMGQLGPTVQFDFPDGTHATAWASDDLMVALGTDVRHGDRYRVTVYPRTRFIATVTKN